MLSSLTSKLIAAGIATILVGGILYIAWSHYTGLVQSKVDLTKQVSQLETSLETQKAATAEAVAGIARWEADRKKILQTLETVNANSKEARDEAAKTQEIFSKHDIGALAKRKPGLIEGRINAGTATALKRLRCASTPGGRCAPEALVAPADLVLAGPGPDTDVSRPMESDRSWWRDLLRLDP